MKKIVLLISLCFAGFAAKASFDTNATDQLKSSFSPLLQATNYSFIPYATYAPSLPTKLGGGVLAIYNVNDYVGAGVGVDWLGNFSLVSGNVTLKKTFHLGNYINWKPLASVDVTPFGIIGSGVPLGGSAGTSPALITDVGGQIQFGHLLGGRFGTGVAWGRWDNAGAYTGARYHLFLSWQKGF